MFFWKTGEKKRFPIEKTAPPWYVINNLFLRNVIVII